MGQERRKSEKEREERGRGRGGLEEARKEGQTQKWTKS